MTPPRAAAVHDVLIVGAGVVGSTLAGLLRANPLTRRLRVGLVDPGSVDGGAAATSAVPDPRCSTLTPASVRCLQSAGAWEHVQRSGRCAAFHSMQVWDAAAAAPHSPAGGGVGAVRYTAAEAGQPCLGHVVENAVLSAALHARLRHDAQHSSSSSGGGGDDEDAAPLQLVCPDTVQQVCLPPGSVPQAAATHDAGPDWAAVRLERGGWVRARLVVAADGGRSPTRRLAGLVRTVGWRYPQTAVVGVVTTRPGDHGTAWQRFLPHGPLAVLPMHGGYSSVVWTTSHEHAAQLVAQTDEQFAAQVHGALHGHGRDARRDAVPMPGVLAAALLAWRLLHGGGGGGGGGGVPEGGRGPAVDAGWMPPPDVGPAPGGARACFPLALRHAPTYVLPRLALVGDAAHAVHPLAGQGLNLGITDARLLATALEEAVRSGCDVGDAAVLQRYARHAAHANAPMVAAVDVLHRLFASSSPAVAALRSAGLSAVNASPALRRAIITYATGGETVEGLDRSVAV